MPIVPALCTQCGAAVEVNDAQDAAICPHCRTPFIVEKAINHYHTTHNYQINGGVVNIHAGPSLEELYQNAMALILGAGGFTWKAFLSGAVLSAIPGIVLQIVLIPLIVLALRRAKLME